MHSEASVKCACHLTSENVFFSGPSSAPTLQRTLRINILLHTYLYNISEHSALERSQTSLMCYVLCHYPLLLWLPSRGITGSQSNQPPTCHYIITPAAACSIEELWFNRQISTDPLIRVYIIKVWRGGRRDGQTRTQTNSRRERGVGRYSLVSTTDYVYGMMRCGAGKVYGLCV